MEAVLERVDEKEVVEIIGCAVSHKLSMPIVKKHSKSLSTMLSSNLSNTIPIKGAEIGCWAGDNAVYLLETIPNLTLWCVDRWQQATEYDKQHDRSRMSKYSQEVFDGGHLQFLSNAVSYILNGRCIVRRTDSLTAANEISPVMKFDFVFIDAMHYYQAVWNDLNAWHPLVRQGGILSGHDYGGRSDRTGRYGVKRAVDEFAVQHELTVNVEPGEVWWCKV